MGEALVDLRSVEEIELITKRLREYHHWRNFNYAGASEAAKLYRFVSLTNDLDRLGQIVLELKSLEGISE